MLVLSSLTLFKGVLVEKLEGFRFRDQKSSENERTDLHGHTSENPDPSVRTIKVANRGFSNFVDGKVLEDAKTSLAAEITCYLMFFKQTAHPVFFLLDPIPISKVSASMTLNDLQDGRRIANKINSNSPSLSSETLRSQSRSLAPRKTINFLYQIFITFVLRSTSN